MQCSRLAQSKEIFTIVPHVMLDDWHLKCVILQDRNLHDDTVTQGQAAPGTWGCIIVDFISWVIQ